MSARAKARVDLVFAELTSSGWIDLIVYDANLSTEGPQTKRYQSQLLECLKRKKMSDVPGLILPHVLRSVGFSQITRVQVLLPTFWRDPKDSQICVRNGRTGEKSYMTMSEVGDRVSTLMLGFWEMMHGEWDDDVEDITTRNRIRRKEAETSRTYTRAAKIWARKR